MRTIHKLRLAGLGLYLVAGTAAAQVGTTPQAVRSPRGGATPAATAAGISITTWQANNQHTGNNSQETVLTPANVGAQGNFVQLFAQPLNDAALEVGQTMGEPLVLAGVNIGGTAHTVVFVCTEHGRIYAYDGDTKDSTLGTDKALWEKNLVPSTDAPFLESDTNSPDIGPELALTTTPVIDPGTNILYVAVKTRRATDNPVTFHQYLYALNAADSSEAVPHVEITATFAGAANETGSTGTTFPFNPQKEQPPLRDGDQQGRRRIALSGLRLAHGRHALPRRDPRLRSQDPEARQKFLLTRKANAGGLWGSGASLAFDLSGNLIVMTGNGNYDPTVANGGEWGESFIKLATSGTTLAVGDTNPIPGRRTTG